MRHIAFFKLQIQDVQSPRSVSYFTGDKCFAVLTHTVHYKCTSVVSLTSDADI